jgi:hypothetical protein
LPTLPPTPAPTPGPLPAPTPAPVPPQVISEATSPLVTFLTLLLQEQERQDRDRQYGQDNVVDDNQCRR